MSSIEFYVRNVLRADGGEILVIGVPNNGLTLSVGDRFKLKYEVSRSEVVHAVPCPVHLNVRHVDLAVAYIDVRHERVRQVAHGMTAALALEGSGLEVVVSGCFLRT